MTPRRTPPWRLSHSRARAAGLAFVATLTGCAHAAVNPTRAAAVAEPGATTDATTAEPNATVSAPPRAGLRACEVGWLEVDFAKLRASKRGDWLGRILAHDPRFGELAVPGKVDPYRDARSVLLCAEVFRGGDWDAAVLGHALDDLTVSAALRVYSARVDHGGPEALGVPGAQATRVRVGTSVWSAVHARGGELLLVTPDAAVESARLHVAAAPRPRGLEGDLAMRARVLDPGARLPGAGAEISRLRALRAEVHARADGGAALHAVGEAPSAADADAIAAGLAARVENLARSFLVRVALRGLLDAFEVKARGARVEVSLPATAAQVDSLLALVAADLGVRLDTPPPAP